MASNRELKIRAQKRQQFRDRQNRKRIVSQLEALRGAGYSTDEIREAGNDAFSELGGTFENGRYVVRDGDTVQTIAEKAGVDAADVLKANPEVRQFDTGMVVSLPGNPTWRAQNVNQAGGIGLPSNAALGATTPNPQGNNPFSNLTGSAGATPFLNYNSTTPMTPATLAANQNAYRPPARPARPAGTGVGGLAQSIIERNRANPNFTGAPPRPNVPATGIAQLAMQAQPTAPQTAQPARPAGPARTVINTALPPGFQNYSMMEENYHYNLLRKVNSPTYTPSQADLNYLEHVGLIKKKPPQPAYVGGGGYSSRRRGGGGGGRAPAPPRQTGSAPPPQERLPAFGSGAGFGGLVNWRI